MVGTISRVRDWRVGISSTFPGEMLVQEPPFKQTENVVLSYIVVYFDLPNELKFLKPTH